MANHFNHPRIKRRTHEFIQLNAQALKQLRTITPNTIFDITGLNNIRLNSALRLTRTTDGVLIHLDNDMRYRVRFIATAVTYGLRYWYQCPNCKQRCTALYLSTMFLCRECAKAAYTSQNGSTIDNLISRIRVGRRKLWPDMDYQTLINTLESCDCWPKPKGKHWRTFEVERGKILRLEVSLFNRFRIATDRRVTHYSGRAQL